MPTDPATLTGWELSLAVAERAGWQDLALVRGGPHQGRWFGAPPGGDGITLAPLPAYHASLDACFRDLVTELAERGWRAKLEKEEREGGEYRAEFNNLNEQTGGYILSAYDPEPATALARCYLAVKAHEAGTEPERAPWATASVEGWL